ncbi:hypothetical protein N7481_008743 [Penicillium waksmanii]|uniref:uncharacterized protein n=1 Tax=Penicillium waksmanii TaxID=69791 RepID=UPI0025484CC8|nr:uncharacterized protein N7481_008743 [Penicillium waksmanii]KAJ5975036.1 hypothetical protein N7481_008743 [Penicillium waksmanii]
MTKVQTLHTLSPRYQIRKLTLADLSSAKALLVQSKTSPSSICPAVESGNQTILAYQQYHAVEDLVRHTINSNMSFGVFDTEYTYRYPSSIKTGGKLHWDVNDIRASSKQLLHQIDFPLVSIALSHDAADPPDEHVMRRHLDIRPGYAQLCAHLESLIPASARDGYRDAPLGKVLMRKGSVTRGDYEGRGIMKGLALWLVVEAKRRGFEIIEIPVSNAIVRRVWENLPPPCRVVVMAEYVIEDLEVCDENGRKKRPFEGIKTEICQLRIKL